MVIIENPKTVEVQSYEGLHLFHFEESTSGPHKGHCREFDGAREI